MTKEEITREIEYVLETMNRYEWASAQKELINLQKRLTETPADIHYSYGYFNQN